MLPPLGTVPEKTVRVALRFPVSEQAWALLELLAPPSTIAVIDKIALGYLQVILSQWEDAADLRVGELFHIVSMISVPKNREALAADLIAKNMRLRQFPSDEYTWSDLKIIIKHLDMHSALYGAVYPERAGWDRQNMLLADISDRLHWLQWAQTKDGRKGRNRPKPIPRPGYVEEQRKGAKVAAAPLSEIKAKLAKRYADNAALAAPKTLTAALGRRLPVSNPPPADRASAIAAAFHGRR